jgi:hypothetical protein
VRHDGQRVVVGGQSHFLAGGVEVRQHIGRVGDVDGPGGGGQLGYAQPLGDQNGTHVHAVAQDEVGLELLRRREDGLQGDLRPGAGHTAEHERSHRGVQRGRVTFRQAGQAVGVLLHPGAGVEVGHAGDHADVVVLEDRRQV